MNFFEKLKSGLLKTKTAIFSPIAAIFKNKSKIDDDMLEELEELLISADIGFSATEEIIDKLRERLLEEKLDAASDGLSVLKEILVSMIDSDGALDLSTTPSVIMMIGVNGVGKTTSVAKLAHSIKGEHKKVLLAAADTFRAGAIDQLGVWADRAGVDLIKQSEGSDPAAVVFDAANAAKSRKTDVLIVDTAGRLHNKKNLMAELAKIDRVIDRELPGTSRETLLVLDATTGQNAVMQAKEFKDAANITGLILTKLDGTAKGGMIFSVKKELDIPVKYVGVGEKIDDLQPFDARSYVDALFE